MDIRALRQERQLKLADQQEHRAVAFDDSQFGMSGEGFRVERGYAAEGPVDTLFLQVPIDRLPELGQCSAESKFGLDVDIEVPYRSVRRLEHVGTTDLVFLILVRAQPDEACKLVFDQRGKAHGAAFETLSNDPLGTGEILRKLALRGRLHDLGVTIWPDFLQQAGADRLSNDEVLDQPYSVGRY